jgi:hypothetical protein
MSTACRPVQHRLAATCGVWMWLITLSGALAAATARAVGTSQAPQDPRVRRAVGGIRPGSSSLPVASRCQNGTCTSTASGREKRLTKSIG